MLTLEQLRAVCLTAPTGRLAVYAEPLNSAMQEFAIHDGLRAAHFLPQLLHESAEFRYTQELASGLAYEGRLDLGNDQPGDGRKYKGHGPMQITGKKNHFLCADALGIPRSDIVDYLCTPEGGCRGAGWFWQIGAGLNLSNRAHAHGIPDGVDLNSLADRDDVESITIAVNGGLNGYAERQKYLARAKKVLQ